MANTSAINITGNTVYNNFVTQYIKPEIKKRQTEGTLSKPIKLVIARAIFCLDKKPVTPIIQINEDITHLDIKLKSGISKKAGEPIFESDIDWGSGILLPKEYANCGHMTILFIGNRRYLSFDFRYSKAKSRSLIHTARQFYETASDNLSKKYYSPFIDNLYSASELAAMSITLTMLSVESKQLVDHKSVYDGFLKATMYGNVPKNVKRAFNELHHERVQARYLKNRDELYTINERKAQRLHSRTIELIEIAEKMIN
jgi:hypothetical protein